MATCRDIVARALRMSGIVRHGRDPKASELDEGMFALQGLYDAWFTGGMFGRLEDYQSEDDYDARAGQRIFVTSGIVTLPVNERDYPIRDLAAIEINDVTGRKAYVWDRQAWVRVDALEPSDEAPLSNRGAEGLAACLATWIVEDYGETPTPMVMAKAGSYKTNLRLQFGSEQEPVPGQYF